MLQLNKCCQCCLEKHGCGVARPDLLVRNNATLVGHGMLPGDTLHRDGDIWEHTAAQDNFVWMDRSSGLPMGFIFNNSGTSLTPLEKLMAEFFKKFAHVDISAWGMVRTFYNVSTEPISTDVFALPDYCKTSTGVFNQCGGEWCPLLRNNVA